MLAATNSQKEKASAVPLRGRDYTDASRSLVKVVRAVSLTSWEEQSLSSTSRRET